MHQPLHLRRKGAKSIFKFFEKIIDFHICGGFAETMIDFHAERGFRDIGGGKGRIVSKLQFGVIEGGGGLFLEGFNGPLQQLAVKMEPDG